MLGAALGSIFPWHLVPLVFTFLVLAASGLATRALALQALGDAPSTLAGCIAISFGYPLYTAFSRCAFGEFTGGFWIPLLLLFALRDRSSFSPCWRRALDGSTLPLAVVYAGVWLSNIPLALMASYTLAITSILASIWARSCAHILRACLATALGLGLAAFFVLPAAYEQPWADFARAIEHPRMQIEYRFLFFPRPYPGLLQQHFSHQDYLFSCMAISMLSLALVGAVFACKSGYPSVKNSWWVPLAFLPVLIFLLQFPVSLPIWNLLPKLRYLQFPWRWLVVLQAPMAFFLAAALWPNSKKNIARRSMIAAVCAILILANVAISGLFFHRSLARSLSISDLVTIVHSGNGLLRNWGEYVPPQTSRPVPLGLPFACLSHTANARLLDASNDPDWQHKSLFEWESRKDLNADLRSCDAVFSRFSGNTEHRRLTADLPYAGYLILRLRSFPAWKVLINGNGFSTLPQRQDSLLTVPVPQGPVTLTVDWITTPDVWAGRILTLLAVLALTALWIFERRAPRRHLS
jgi:hypothetical protein